METDPECLLIAYYCKEVAVWVEGSCGITDEPEPSSRRAGTRPIRPMRPGRRRRRRTSASTQCDGGRQLGEREGRRRYGGWGRRRPRWCGTAHLRTHSVAIRGSQIVKSGEAATPATI